MKVVKNLLVAGLMLGAVGANATITDKDVRDFQNKFGGGLTTKQLNQISKFANERGMDMKTAINSMKAKSKGNGLSLKAAGAFCCWNISGQYGNHYWYQGADYCMPSCQ